MVLESDFIFILLEIISFDNILSNIHNGLNTTASYHSDPASHHHSNEYYMSLKMYLTFFFDRSRYQGTVKICINVQVFFFFFQLITRSSLYTVYKPLCHFSKCSTCMYNVMMSMIVNKYSIHEQLRQLILFVGNNSDDGGEQTTKPATNSTFILLMTLAPVLGVVSLAYVAVTVVDKYKKEHQNEMET